MKPFNTRRHLAPMVLAVLTACGEGSIGYEGVDRPDGQPARENPQEAEQGTVVQPLSTDEQRVYLGAIAPWLLGRVLTQAELDALDSDDGISTVLEDWRDEPGLANAARRFVDNLLFTGGSAGDIDHRLPGNIAHTVARQGLPWSEILTSDRCYDGDGNATACDSGAPYTAGVLTTRAYLAGRASRFNLTRASTMMRVFACREYPLTEQEEPHIEKSRLLVLFRAETQEEQADARAAAGFGNGSECYACHGQFSLHAQPFVRFDEDGRWREDATGLHDPAEFAELGRSVDGLMTSHLQDPEEARSEASQMLGTEVENLAEGAVALANSDLFLPCQVRHLIQTVFSVDSTKPVQEALVERVAEAAQARAAEPSFHDIVFATFTSRPVIDAYLTSLPTHQPSKETAP